MGTTEACADELVKEENSISKVAVVEANNVIVMSQSSSPPAANHILRSSIGPLTPDSNREININGEQQDHEYFSSPLAVVLSINNSSETPKETLFDSFAPGPDKLMLAPPPHHNSESLIHVVRRPLNFNLLRYDINNHESNMETISDDEHLFEIVYGTILDAVVSEQQQTKEVGVVKFPTRVISGFDGFRTPKSSAPHDLSCGIAETCPGAPMKSTSKYRNIDKEICKKLEF